MMSSTGFVTVVSISSTLAPGSTVVTVHTGKSTLGNRSTPSSLYETKPSTTGITTSTQVNTGRLIQISERVMETPERVASGKWRVNAKQQIENTWFFFLYSP